MIILKKDMLILTQQLAKKLTPKNTTTTTTITTTQTTIPAPMTLSIYPHPSFVRTAYLSLPSPYLCHPPSHPPLSFHERCRNYSSWGSGSPLYSSSKKKSHKLAILKFSSIKIKNKTKRKIHILLYKYSLFLLPTLTHSHIPHLICNHEGHQRFLPSCFTHIPSLNSLCLPSNLQFGPFS